MTAKPLILAVDDDPINLGVVAEILEEAYDVVTADSGESAVHLAVRHAPDLVLLDVMLPGIDGYEVCRRIRAQPGLAHTKVILVSAKTTIEDRLRGYDSGADDYVTKPFDDDELTAKVKIFLRLKTEEELGRLKSHLLDLVAHEIRTPLTGILPSAELLSAEEPLDEGDRRFFADLILQSSRRLASLADKGLLLCELRSGGHRRLSLESLDPAAALEAALREVEPMAREQSVTFDVRLSPVPPIAGHRRYLQLVALMLLQNAVRTSADGSRIRVELGREDDAVELAVTGAGPRSTEVEVQSLLDDFAAEMIDGQVVGSSLNMAVAQEVLRAHGGQLVVHTAAGGQTRVSARLPVGPG